MPFKCFDCCFLTTTKFHGLPVSKSTFSSSPSLSPFTRFHLFWHWRIDFIKMAKFKMIMIHQTRNVGTELLRKVPVLIGWKAKERRRQRDNRIATNERETSQEEQTGRRTGPFLLPTGTSHNRPLETDDEPLHLSIVRFFNSFVLLPCVYWLSLNTTYHCYLSFVYLNLLWTVNHKETLWVVLGIIYFSVFVLYFAHTFVKDVRQVLNQPLT